MAKGLCDNNRRKKKLKEKTMNKLEEKHMCAYLYNIINWNKINEQKKRVISKYIYIIKIYYMY